MSKIGIENLENMLALSDKPENKLDILRKSIFSNDLCDSSYCISRYFECFDNTNKGLAIFYIFLWIYLIGYNNYADDILSNIKNLNNGNFTFYLYDFY